jgi:sugar O-acyltransferase (sialic acid O-acetyltransferase NeuD family)
MLIYGASGHGKVILDCLESLKIPFYGFFDDDDSKKELLGYPVLGRYNKNYLKSEKLIIAIGDNYIRNKVANMTFHEFGTIIHPQASVSKNVKIGLGTVIFNSSVVQSSVSIGNHVIINTNANIDHDCTIGDFVHICPGVTICGGVNIGENSMIGAGSVVIPNIKIGKNVMVGAGSVVIKDIPEGKKVFGNPAKIYGINK